MDENSESPSVVELASVVGGFVAGITTITIQLFPFALPLLALVIAPLVVLALAGLLLALPVVVPLWLGRLAWRALRRERGPEPEADGRPVLRQHRGQLAQ
jgi:membrane protein implicated in regulation of membrane protease activity